MHGEAPSVTWPVPLLPTIRRLRELGLDLVHPFSVRTAEKTLGDEVRFPALSAIPGDYLKNEGELHTIDAPLGLFIGNTRALWLPFVTSPEALQKDPPCPDPLDTYVERSVSAALSLSQLEFQVSYAHTRLPTAIPIQRMADAAGFAHLGPAHLSVHPVYGPWFALRAVVVLRLAETEVIGLRHGSAPSLCSDCAAPCTGALAEALHHHSEPPPPQHVQLATSPLRLSNHSQAWARVRLVCPVGGQHQYSAPQMKYHYDKSRGALFADNLRRLHPTR